MVIRISQLKVEIKNLKEPNKKGFVNEEERRIIHKKICKLLSVGSNTPLDLSLIHIFKRFKY